MECPKLREAFEKALEKEDENVLHYIGQGIRERGYLTPQDLFYVICWKAPAGETSYGKAVNYAFECISQKGVEGVKAVTREAIELSKKDVEKAIEKLSELHGVKTRVASAILTFYNPEKFGAMDKKAWKALYNEEKGYFEPKDYAKYLKNITELAKRCSLTPRQVDLALWYIGGRRKKS